MQAGQWSCLSPVDCPADNDCCMLEAVLLDCVAGWVMLLSTAYRLWAVWRFDMRMPFPVFGTSDQWEAANFLRVKVHRGCRRSVHMPHDPVARTQDTSTAVVVMCTRL
jgi:hypothetical protein